jgi:hypothetical protein
MLVKNTKLSFQSKKFVTIAGLDHRKVIFALWKYIQSRNFRTWHILYAQFNGYKVYQLHTFDYAQACEQIALPLTSDRLVCGEWIPVDFSRPEKVNTLLFDQFFGSGELDRLVSRIRASPIVLFQD